MLVVSQFSNEIIEIWNRSLDVGGFGKFEEP
jgi:hypothetical protein